jgi:glycosyltransferase involved in cell wall biosynthesis
VKIAILMATYSRFDDTSATAVDLCVRDGCINSRYQATTTVFGPPNASHFEGVRYESLPGYPKGWNDRSSLSYVRNFIERLKRDAVDLVVMQDDWRAAGYLAHHSRIPVLFHTHTYLKRKSGFARINRLGKFRRLAGMIFVSEDARQEFVKDWGKPCQGFACLNGIDATLWKPAPEADRTKEIVFTGRCLDWKGVAELIEALPSVLTAYPEWKARFILNALDQQPEYTAKCLDALKSLDERVTIDRDAPHSRVKRACETCSIGVVPSIRNESFGRVAMEFMAGGAAVLTSGRGGLREAVGDAALYCEPAPAALAAGLKRLIGDAALRASYSKRGRQRTLDALDIKRTTAAIDDVYEQVLLHHRR